MDQAESQNQELSWNQRKRCHDANLCCDYPLSFGRIHQIPAWIQAQPHGIDEPNPRYAYAESFPARNPRTGPQDHFEAAGLEFARTTRTFQRVPMLIFLPDSSGQCPQF